MKIKISILLIAAFLCLAPSCKTTSLLGDRRKSDTNAAALNEASKELTTAARDALNYAPTNPPTDLAKKFLDMDQQIEGMPIHRIDVEGILQSNTVAIAELTTRFRTVDTLLEQRRDLEAKLRESEAALIEMGKKYEEEKNKSFWRRFKFWGIANFGVLGFVAFCIVCPGLAFPILIGVVKFIITIFPKLVGAVGVVGKATVDNIVKGVGEVRKYAKKNSDQQMTAAEWLAFMDTEMKKATDGPDRGIIEARRAVLKV